MFPELRKLIATWKEHAENARNMAKQMNDNAARDCSTVAAFAADRSARELEKIVNEYDR